MTDDQDDGDGPDWLHSMSREKLAVAVAGLVKREQGANAPTYIAEMIDRFERQGNEDGVATWKEIATAYLKLLGSPGAKN